MKHEKLHKYKMLAVPDVLAHIKLKWILGSFSLSPNSPKLKYIFSESPGILHSVSQQSQALH